MPEFHGRFSSPIAELCAGINVRLTIIIKKKNMYSLFHFAASTMAPLFEVYEVYDNKSHEFHEALLKDLDGIS
jgi:hypothetical protein